MMFYRFSLYWGANLNLPLKGQRWTYGHHLNKYGKTWVPDGIYLYIKIQPQSFLGSEEED